jgi:hypothetical protein
MTPAFWFEETPVHWWQLLVIFNLVTAWVLGGLLAVSFRSLALIAAEGQRGRSTTVRRAAIGILFLVLGALYAMIVWPMIVWNHPARILTVGTAVLVPVVAAARRRRNPGGPFPRPRPVLGILFIAVLLFLAAATSLRAGLVTLKGHRVVQLVEVTGETRPETISAAGDPGGTVQVTAHHVILVLTDGSVGADVWVYGSRVAFTGRALLVSKAFNRLDVPNLYEYLTIHNGARDSDGGEAVPYFSVPFPDGGSLGLRPWWRGARNAMLNAWASLGRHSSLLGLRMVYNQSPYYPLTEAQGKPLKEDFLFDLMLDGIPTSRGSSPLERR